MLSPVSRAGLGAQRVAPARRDTAQAEKPASPDKAARQNPAALLLGENADPAARQAASDLSQPRGDDPLTAAVKEFKRKNRELLDNIRRLSRKQPLAKDARDRLARAKERLKALKAMAGVALASKDKRMLKAIAQEIARLAREVGQAAKDMSEAARAGAFDAKSEAATAKAEASAVASEGAGSAKAEADAEASDARESAGGKPDDAPGKGDYDGFAKEAREIAKELKELMKAVRDEMERQRGRSRKPDRELEDVRKLDGKMKDALGEMERFLAEGALAIAKEDGNAQQVETVAVQQVEVTVEVRVDIVV